ncbi:MAG TPA: hypothetical protein VFH27_12765 [Longimicrobiaceae bacterium]|nr:hypothetical protein [Longimicrobiaceae bacterium]
MKTPFAVVLAAVVLTGCVSARATMLGPTAQRAPVAEDQVRIYLAADSVPSSCERIALIDLEGSAQMTNETQMLRAGRRRAGKIGANAIKMGDQVKEPGTGRIVASALLGVSANRKTQFTAFICP